MRRCDNYPFLESRPGKRDLLYYAADVSFYIAE